MKRSRSLPRVVWLLLSTSRPLLIKVYVLRTSHGSGEAEGGHALGRVSLQEDRPRARQELLACRQVPLKGVREVGSIKRQGVMRHVTGWHSFKGVVLRADTLV